MLSQRGQALVGVMVAMIVLFALAGAVAIGASTLLTGRGQSDATNRDFQVHSAVNDSMAQIAGAPLRCGAPPPLPSPSPTPSPTSTPLPLALSLPAGGGSQQAFCARVDDAVLKDVQRYEPLSGCATIPLGPGGRLAVLFDSRTTAAGWAYLDSSSGAATCGVAPSTSQQPPCLETWSKSGGARVLQVALTCDLPAGQAAFLHMDVSGAQPRHVFAVHENPAAEPNTIGFLFLVASGTGLSTPDYEESVYSISQDRSSRRLLYEAPLG